MTLLILRIVDQTLLAKCQTERLQASQELQLAIAPVSSPG